jgi:aryl-alcohol dehydrogenase-like predicted oxidoreductase
VEAGHSKAAYRILGRTGLTVSALGFGAYRVDAGTEEHRAALEKALLGGCNLIDTSTNYTDGESEQQIGETLETMSREGRIAREEIVVVSKIGYVQGRNLDLARRREAAGEPFPEMVKISGGCWHCMHPEFLADQLTRSLERLRLERLDVCLLHNPEYFLEQAQDEGRDLEEARREFYRRIGAAFAHLEREVRSGRIAWYGVSSNSFGAEAGSHEATSLGRMLAAAEGAAMDASQEQTGHHFAVAQLPMNLYEHGPATTRKEGPSGRLSTLAFASEQGIGILVNRPLNAFHEGELIRLADLRQQAPSISLEEALVAVSGLEQELERSLGAPVKAATGRTAAQWFDWGDQLRDAAPGLEGYERWQAIEDQQITPRLFYSVRSLRSALASEPAEHFEEWLGRYLPALGDLLAALRSRSAQSSRERSERIASALHPDIPAALRGESLSRKALHAVASVPGVTCVLNGMRRTEYVEDSMGILKWDPIPGAEKLFGRL